MRSVLRVLIVMLLASLLLVIAFTAGFATNLIQAKLQPGSATIPTNFGLFWEAWNIVKGEYYGSVPDRQVMTHGAIRGMLDRAGRPTYRARRARRGQDRAVELAGPNRRRGSEPRRPQSHVGDIVSAIPNSPSEKAGLKGGDVILKIGDKDIAADITVQVATNMLRGPIDSHVPVIVHHVGESKPFTADLIRAKYALPTVEAKVLPKTTYGYVKVMLETSETAAEFAKALDTLKAQHITGVVPGSAQQPGGIVSGPGPRHGGTVLEE